MQCARLPVSRRSAKTPGTSRAAANQVRIIGGRWRGRRLAFAPAAGLRPTPDRVRETVFNWLAPRLEGAAVLDLYAGSGAFGLEALSRGAANAVLVDHDPAVAKTLQQQATALGAEALQVVLSDVNAYLNGPVRPMDVVFVDPPYGRGLLAGCCEALQRGGWLHSGAAVYLEAEADSDLPPLPPQWELVRSKKAGHVGYYLALVKS